MKNVKNLKILSIFLAAFWILQSLTLPISATEGTELSETSASEEAAPTDSAPEEQEETEETGAPETVSPPAEAPLGGDESSNFGVDAPRALAGPDELDLDAEALLLLELNSQTMVYAKNIDTRREPASLTKVMTCLLALEHGNLTDSITVSQEALDDLDPAGSSSGLMAGEVFTLEQLLYCLMIESANDAAPVIAEYVAGSEPAFVEMMNQKAAELGCTGTHFANTHGLHDEEHYTTARDLAKIMMAALEYEKFQEIYSADRYTLAATNLQEERILVTTNYLIDASITSDYYDERVIGGKTGFTTPAGRCVMCVAESGNLRYLCVVLGASSTGADGSTYFGSFVSASEALDLGFDSFTFAEVLSPLAPIAQLPVAHATQSVVVTPAESVTTMLPKDYDKSLLSTRYQLTSEAGLDAPLEAGQAVGVVQEYYGSICVGQTDLVTVTGVERNAFGAVVMQVKGEIAQSPWQFVAIVLAVLLGIFLLLLIWSTWVRRRNRKRRQNRRKGN